MLKARPAARRWRKTSTPCRSKANNPSRQKCAGGLGRHHVRPGPLRRHRLRRRCGGMMCAATAASATAGAGRRSLPARGEQDPDLGRRAVQFHQPPRRARPPVGPIPHSVKIGARGLAEAGFVRAARPVHGIAWTKRGSGQLFCDGSAQQIVDLLLAECAGLRGDRCGPRSAAVGHAGARFSVSAHLAGTASAPALVIATGDRPMPKLGATAAATSSRGPFGLRWSNLARRWCR